MSPAARILAAQQEHRRRRLVLAALLAPQNECQPKRSAETTEDTATGEDAPRRHAPRRLCISERQALAVLHQLYPTAILWVHRGRTRTRGQGGATGTGAHRGWHKPLPWVWTPTPPSAAPSVGESAAGPAAPQPPAARPADICGKPNCPRCNPSQLKHPPAAADQAAPERRPAVTSSVGGPRTQGYATEGPPGGDDARSPQAPSAQPTPGPNIDPWVAQFHRIAKILIAVESRLRQPSGVASSESWLCLKAQRRDQAWSAAWAEVERLEQVFMAGPAAQKPLLELAERLRRDAHTRVLADNDSVESWLAPEGPFHDIWCMTEDPGAQAKDVYDAFDRVLAPIAVGHAGLPSCASVLELIMPAEAHREWAALLQTATAQEVHQVAKLALQGLVLLMVFKCCRPFDFDFDPYICAATCVSWRIAQVLGLRAASPRHIYTLFQSVVPFDLHLPPLGPDRLDEAAAAAFGSGSVSLARWSEGPHLFSFRSIYQATLLSTHAPYLAENWPCLLVTMPLASAAVPAGGPTHVGGEPRAAGEERAGEGSAQAPGAAEGAWRSGGGERLQRLRSCLALQVRDFVAWYLNLQRRSWHQPGSAEPWVDPPSGPTAGGAGPRAAVEMEMRAAAAPPAVVCGSGVDGSREAGDTFVRLAVQELTWMYLLEAKTLPDADSASGGEEAWDVERTERKMWLKTPEVAVLALLSMDMELFKRQQQRVVFQPDVNYGQQRRPHATTASGVATAAGGGAGGEELTASWAEAGTKTGPEILLHLRRLPWFPSNEDPGYRWPEFKQWILTITATGSLATHIKAVREALVRKRLMFIWLQGKGVEGVQRMLQVLTQVRREMLELGRDVCAAPVWWNRERQAPGRKPAGRAQAGSNGDARQPSQHHQQPQQQQGPKPSPPSEGSLQELTEAVKGFEVVFRRLVGAPTPKEGPAEEQGNAAAAGDVMSPVTRELAEGADVGEGAKQRNTLLASERVVELLTQPGPAREGWVLELAVLECEPRRPEVIVRPQEVQLSQAQQLQLQNKERARERRKLEQQLEIAGRR